MVSDMLGEGAFQSRSMTAGGISDNTAKTVHPANDVTPNPKPTVATARTQAAITAALT
jgi:hypothetical protein